MLNVIMRKIILSLFIVISLLFINTAIVNACSCVQPAPPKESLEHSTAVFAGKVVDIDVPSGLVISSADPVKVTFEVLEIWKGHDYKTLVLTTARDGASCGYSFKQNEEYIVYAYGEENKLSAGICSRTKLLTNAQEDLRELGEGNLPSNSSSGYIPQTFNLIQIISAVGFAVVLIVIVVLIRKYKK